MIILIYIW